jgi:phosphocarrier protein
VIEQRFVIMNELGLHARAATRFVQTANRFACEVEVEKDGQKVNGKSIMGVLMLVAAKGTAITIRSSGRDEAAAMTALGSLIRNKFDEE